MTIREYVVVIVLNESSKELKVWASSHAEAESRVTNCARSIGLEPILCESWEATENDSVSLSRSH